jgi:hypothetical protein
MWQEIDVASGDLTPHVASGDLTPEWPTPEWPGCPDGRWEA